jgi:hypothetical protein
MVLLLDTLLHEVIEYYIDGAWNWVLCAADAHNDNAQR